MALHVCGKGFSRRSFLRVAAAAGGTALLAACGTGTPPPATPAPASGAAPAAKPTGGDGGQKKVSLIAWNLSPLQTDWLKVNEKTFNESQKDYQITVEATTFPGRELAEKIIGTFVANSGSPDYPFIQEWDFTKYIRGGYIDSHLVNLGAKMSAQEMKDAFYEENWSWKGKTYGLNIDMSLSIYYYREDVFKEIGESPEKWETYDDFVKAGQNLKQKKNAFMTALDTAGWNQYLILAYQNGGGWFSKDGKNVLDSQENIQALQFWLDMVKKTQIAWPTGQFYGPGTTEAHKASQVVGMLIPDWYHNQYLVNQLPDQAGKWRIRPLPRFASGGARTAHRGGTAMTIAKSAKEQDAAWAFMRQLFLDMKGATSRFTSPLGQFPSYAPAWKAAEVLDFAPPFFGGQKINSVLAEIAPECPDYYAHPFKTEALDMINADVLPAVLDGKKTPEQALKDAKTKLDGAIKNSGFEI